MDTIGKLIGIVEDNLSVTNNSDVSVKIRAFYDYSGMNDAEVKANMVDSGTRIKFQRVLRTMSKDEIKALDGKTLDACTIGRKVKSDAEVKSEYKARFSASSPEAQRQMIDELESQAQELMLQNAKKNKELREVKDETDEDDLE